jgi:hypothetical protein
MGAFIRFSGRGQIFGQPTAATFPSPPTGLISLSASTRVLKIPCKLLELISLGRMADRLRLVLRRKKTVADRDMWAPYCVPYLPDPTFPYFGNRWKSRFHFVPLDFAGTRNHRRQVCFGILSPRQGKDLRREASLARIKED